MSLYIPIDIANQIQSYMDSDSYIISLRICRSFQGGDSERIYNYRNSEIELPNWVTKVVLGNKIEKLEKLECIQLVYLDMNQNTNPIDLNGCKNLKVLKLGSSIIYNGCIRYLELEELYLEYNINLIWYIVEDISSLKLLDIGKNEYFCVHLGPVKSKIETLRFDSKNKTSSKVLKDFTTIKHLVLGPCFLLKHIEHLPLESLEIPSLQVMDGRICHFPNLKLLILHHNMPHNITGHSTMKTILK